MDWLEWQGWDGISGIVALLALLLAVVAAVDLLIRWRGRPKFGVAMTLKPDREVINERLRYVVTIRVTGPHTLYEVGFFTDNESHTLDLLTAIPTLSASDEPLEIAISVPAPDTGRSYLAMHYTDVSRVRRRSQIVRLFLNEEARFERWHPFWYEHWYGVRQGQWKQTRSKNLSTFPK